MRNDLRKEIDMELRNIMLNVWGEYGDEEAYKQLRKLGFKYINREDLNDEEYRSIVYHLMVANITVNGLHSKQTKEYSQGLVDRLSKDYRLLGKRQEQNFCRCLKYFLISHEDELSTEELIMGYEYIINVFGEVEYDEYEAADYIDIMQCKFYINLLKNNQPMIEAIISELEQHEDDIMIQPLLEQFKKDCCELAV